MLIAGFPAGRGAPTATSSPPARAASASSSTPARTPPTGVARGRPRAQAQAGRGPGHPRPRRPHVVRGPGRRHLRRHGLDPPGRPAPAGRPDGRACPRDHGRCCSAATTSSPSPTTSASSPTPQDARARRAAVRRRPHPGPHRGLGHLPDAVRREPGHLRGDVLRRPAVRGLDRPHRPARRRPPARCCAACATRCCPCADDIVVLPGHGEQTTIGRERATNPFLPRTTSPESLEALRWQAHPLSGFPELLPAAALRRAAGHRPRCAAPSSCTASPHRDPRRRAAGPAAAQGRDLQGGLRPAPAARGADDEGTPASACTST